uniref:Family with sequence similarity 169 member A n=1 Tax=Nothoprocta perdicaria TaxID=30464 RepID=A0A8C7A1M3_NOTPE
MAFPVDVLNGYSHEDLESSAEDYMSDLRCGDPNRPEFLSLPDHSKIPISLSTVGFVPLYGGEQTHKVLALFAPEDSLTGSVCTSYLTQSYQLPVLDTMFVRKKHRGKDFGLMMLEDFVDSFTEDALGLRYPLSSFMYTACKRYFEKYPGDHDLLWEVEGAGHWFQRTPITTVLQREKFKVTGMGALFCYVAESQKGKESLDVRASTSEGKKPTVTPVSIRTRSSHLKRPRIGKNSQESEPEISRGDEENALHVSESRLEPLAHTSENSEDLAEEPEENAVENDEEMIVDNEDQCASETELHASPPEKRSEKEVMEPLNGEVAEESSKASLTAEEETANEALSGESKLQSESREEPSTLLVPLVLEPPVLNANSSEVLAEETPPLEKDGTEEEQQEAEKKKSSKEENAAASAPRDEPSDNGLPNSVVTEAAEESASENVSPKTASSVEEQNEEAGHNSQEAPVAVGQSGLMVAEFEGVSPQQPSGQEGQKNQAEEQPEESAEQMDQYTQTAAERAADSSSEEAEIEVPIVDRRTLRRKAKGYKGPPKKKGKPA